MDDEAEHQLRRRARGREYLNRLRSKNSTINEDQRRLGSRDWALGKLMLLRHQLVLWLVTGGLCLSWIVWLAFYSSKSTMFAPVRDCINSPHLNQFRPSLDNLTSVILKQTSLPSNLTEHLQILITSAQDDVRQSFVSEIHLDQAIAGQVLYSSRGLIRSHNRKYHYGPILFSAVTVAQSHAHIAQRSDLKCRKIMKELESYISKEKDKVQAEIDRKNRDARSWSTFIAFHNPTEGIEARVEQMNIMQEKLRFIQEVNIVAARCVQLLDAQIDRGTTILRHLSTIKQFSNTEEPQTSYENIPISVLSAEIANLLLVAAANNDTVIVLWDGFLAKR